MSWQDRLRGEIELTSPDGQVFTAKWSGNSRSVEKKLGIFTYPKVDGAIIQDLGLDSIRYPLTISFDGPDNDLESNRFLAAFSARGTWRVVHPAKGVLQLQPIRVSESIEPVESGSLTVFDTEWIRPAAEGAVSTTVQLASSIQDQVGVVEDAALTQLTTVAKQENIDQVNAIKSATEKSLSVYDKTVGTILELSGELAAAVAAVRRGIAETLDTSPLDLTVLGGQIQSVMRLPSAITGDVLQTIKPFSDFIDQMSVLPDEVADQTYLNVLSIREIFLAGANSSIARSSTGGIFETRAQALEAADLASLEFQTMTDALDSAQEQFEALRIDQQYFSQSITFVKSAQITSAAVRYLLQASFDLAVEKQIILNLERSPIEITITEYGGLGDNDINYDLFIDSNELKGDEILLLPAGRRVVVYV